MSDERPAPAPAPGEDCPRCDFPGGHQGTSCAGAWRDEVAALRAELAAAKERELRHIDLMVKAGCLLNVTDKTVTVVNTRAEAAEAELKQWKVNVKSGQLGPELTPEQARAVAADNLLLRGRLARSEAREETLQEERAILIIEFAQRLRHEESIHGMGVPWDWESLSQEYKTYWLGVVEKELKEKLEARAALAVKDALATTSRPTIVTLCGSIRWPGLFTKAAEEETLAGRIVLSVGVWSMYEYLHSRDGAALKAQLDELHKRKIDLSDEILVVTDHIGESTRSEIEYAKAHGKRVRYAFAPREEPPNHTMTDKKGGPE